MFELPGLTSTGDTERDIQAIRRYLTKFVPQLEQELANLGTDNCSTASNERLEGLTSVSQAGKSNSTSEAIANHLMDYSNPHRVTAAQLGITHAAVMRDGADWVYRHEGRQVCCHVLEAEADGTATKTGPLWYRDVDCGDWPAAFDEITASWAAIVRDEAGISMLGTLSGTDTEACGSVRIWRPAETDEGLTLIVMGVGTYGE